MKDQSFWDAVRRGELNRPKPQPRFEPEFLQLEIPEPPPPSERPDAPYDPYLYR